MEEKLDKLAKLGALFELIDKCHELSEIDNTADDYVSDLLKDAKNETYRLYEGLKAELL